ncbi:hypothetical protein DPX16_0941 [Anabarilius grahami]|uniref:Uncharacterized protein n=1 Tax=Anabarilius grahami TaxID=495550 RepID=A0A3N0XKU5_ANAGA|nr:hypothetical protein DPX16_0941 [Anabarilius grahami]
MPGEILRRDELLSLREHEWRAFFSEIDKVPRALPISSSRSLRGKNSGAGELSAWIRVSSRRLKPHVPHSFHIENHRMSFSPVQTSVPLPSLLTSELGWTLISSAYSPEPLRSSVFIGLPEEPICSRLDECKNLKQDEESDDKQVQEYVLRN